MSRRLQRAALVRVFTARSSSSLPAAPDAPPARAPPSGPNAAHSHSRVRAVSPPRMYEVDTIAAIATPPGPGGIGIVRVSGPFAERLAAEMFQRRAGPWETHRLYHGRILDADGMPIDQGLAVLMRAPHSYTGEDVLELHCHGSPVLLQRVLHALLIRGARPARAGEFTKRAFLNGKLDLAQAEAVAELTRARTVDGASAA